MVFLLLPYPASNTSGSPVGSTLHIQKATASHCLHFYYLLQAAILAVLAWISSIAFYTTAAFPCPFAVHWLSCWHSDQMGPSETQVRLCHSSAQNPAIDPIALSQSQWPTWSAFPPTLSLTSLPTTLAYTSSLQLHSPPCCSSKTLESSYPGGFSLALPSA